MEASVQSFFQFFKYNISSWWGLREERVDRNGKQKSGTC